MRRLQVPAVAAVDRSSSSWSLGCGWPHFCDACVAMRRRTDAEAFARTHAFVAWVARVCRFSEL